jgi:hypothetical protein
MKRLLAIATLLIGFSLAQVPAYPENTIGGGYAFKFGLPSGLGGFLVQGSTFLPFSPLGIDTGLDLEVALTEQLSVWAMIKANLLPALTIADLSMAVSLGLDLTYKNGGFGARFGPLATFEFPGFALSAYTGIGFLNGFSFAYGLGGRLYLDPLAIEVATSDRYDLKLAVLYLW